MDARRFATDVRVATSGTRPCPKPSRLAAKQLTVDVTCLARPSELTAVGEADDLQRVALNTVSQEPTGGDVHNGSSVRQLTMLLSASPTCRPGTENNLRQGLVPSDGARRLVCALSLWLDVDYLS